MAGRDDGPMRPYVGSSSAMQRQPSVERIWQARWLDADGRRYICGFVYFASDSPNPLKHRFSLYPEEEGVSQDIAGLPHYTEEEWAVRGIRTDIEWERVRKEEAKTRADLLQLEKAKAEVQTEAFKPLFADLTTLVETMRGELREVREELKLLRAEAAQPVYAGEGTRE